MLFLKSQELKKDEEYSKQKSTFLEGVKMPNAIDKILEKENPLENIIPAPLTVQEEWERNFQEVLKGFEIISSEPPTERSIEQLKADALKLNTLLF